VERWSGLGAEITGRLRHSEVCNDYSSVRHEQQLLRYIKHAHDLTELQPSHYQDYIASGFCHQCKDRLHQPRAEHDTLLSLPCTTTQPPTLPKPALRLTPCPSRNPPSSSPKSPPSPPPSTTSTTTTKSPSKKLRTPSSASSG